HAPVGEWFRSGPLHVRGILAASQRRAQEDLAGVVFGGTISALFRIAAAMSRGPRGCPRHPGGSGHLSRSRDDQAARGVPGGYDRKRDRRSREESAARRGGLSAGGEGTIRPRRA